LNSVPLLHGHDPLALAAAAQRLADGGLVAMPTETVYGLGARADLDSAVAAIFTAKGRPSDHPLIVHIADEAAAALFAAEWPETAQRLAQAFWPGPVTLIVPRRAGAAQAAAAGQSSVGLRCPSHPVAQALLRRAAALGVAGVAAPSANRFGRVSPTCAAHVEREFGPDLLVLDGGECDVGIESTIIDLSRGAAVLLRPGVLPRQAIEAVLGQPLLDADAQAPRAPGTLASHYAPHTPVRLVPSDTLAAGLHKADIPGKGLAVYSRRAMTPQQGVVWQAMPDDPVTVAHELFAVLRRLDELQCAEIWVEQPVDHPAWEGVADRLRRAAAA
jgi:L-threonylcarbamoyladenylate synthase